MQDKRNITPRNEQGQKHGCWEMYWGNGILFYKCNYVNGVALGFDETYQIDGTINYIAYYAK
jgi:antitoxin component YwqK of YwqJK toxin-antitoxin module